MHVCTYHDESEISLSISNSIVNELFILRHASSLVDERRVCRGVLRFEALDRVDVAGIADDNGVFLELFELRSHDCLFQFVSYCEYLVESDFYEQEVKTERRERIERCSGRC